MKKILVMDSKNYDTSLPEIYRVAVRGGVKLCREYMQHLKDKNDKLKEEIELKNSYLKKVAKGR